MNDTIIIQMIFRFLFKYCLQLPPEGSEGTEAREAGAEAGASDGEYYTEYNKFIKAIRIYDICTIREIKNNKDFVKRILEYIKVNSPEYRMLYMALVSIMRDFDNKSSNEGLKTFIKELLYFENDNVDKNMFKIISHANAIYQDGMVICYKSDHIQSYLNLIK